MKYSVEQVLTYYSQECAECTAKLGAADLCNACYHNRTVIDRLQTVIAELDKKLKQRPILASD